MRPFFLAFVLWGARALAEEADGGELVPHQKDVRDLSLDDLLATPIAVATPRAWRAARRDGPPGVVSAMTREEILASGARDLLEVLQLIPGFSFHTDVEGVVGAGFPRRVGPRGQGAVAHRRIEMNELLYSTNAFGNELPVQGDREGRSDSRPGSALYGGNAELAVINVITPHSEVAGWRRGGGRFAYSHAGFLTRRSGRRAAGRSARKSSSSR